MKNLGTLKKAQWLVNTSVDDMQSGLSNYTTQADLEVLRLGYILTRRRNEKTKAKALASRIRKLEKELSEKEISHE